MNLQNACQYKIICQERQMTQQHVLSKCEIFYKENENTFIEGYIFLCLSYKSRGGGGGHVTEIISVGIFFLWLQKTDNDLKG